MQTNRVFQKKSFIILSFITLFSIIIFISSCSDGDKKVVPLLVTENCYTITREEIKTNMLAGGWSVPGNNDFIPYIYFSPTNESGEIIIKAFPSDKDNRLFTTRKVTIEPPNMTPPCSFPNDLIVDTSRYDFSTEGFANSAGKLIEFDFLRLVPMACTEAGYTDRMVFAVYMVTINAGGEETAMLKGYTKPCPPYCPIQ